MFRSRPGLRQVSMRCIQVVLGNLAETSFSKPQVWSLLKHGVVVSLAILASALLNGCAGAGVARNSTSTSSFSISGTINPAAGGSGAALTLGGAAKATTTADSSGSYTFAGLPNGTYTIVPSHADLPVRRQAKIDSSVGCERSITGWVP